MWLCVTDYKFIQFISLCVRVNHRRKLCLRITEQSLFQRTFKALTNTNNKTTCSKEIDGYFIFKGQIKKTLFNH